MNNRKNFSSQTEWEDKVGYSRLVKVGNIIEVSGTTSVKDNNVIGINDAYAQTVFIIRKIQSYLENAGASLEDVVRTRMFVTDISKWEEIGKAHSEFFHDIKPATTMVEVKSLISPELLIEMEVTAVIQHVE